MTSEIWTKICGITTYEDAAAAARAGVSALGFNFYPRSSRYVSPQETRKIRDQLHADFGADCPEIVGVFVNSDMQTVISHIAESNIDSVQLHGDETLEFISRLHQHVSHIRLIRALRPGSDSSLQTRALILQLIAEIPAIRILLDAFAAGEYGGTGRKIEPKLFAAVTTGLDCPVILAGGLTPQNVADAICRTRPAGVDTAGGVEISAGVKDHAKIRQFLDAVRDADKGEQAHS
jgi:phosphoribosylanthranilate isomerase